MRCEVFGHELAGKAAGTINNNIELRRRHTANSSTLKLFERSCHRERSEAI
jgi:hypothetical protein